MRYAFISLFLFSALPLFSGDLNSLPDNTWVRICNSPGDAIGREVPPGRAATWVYEPGTQRFIRYGGYTPTFTNEMMTFNPEDNAWQILFPHDETFPSNRPGGGSNWMMAYDSARQVIWLAGGFGSRGYSPMQYATGDKGIWKYDPAARTFTKVGDYIGWNTYHTYDPVNDVIVTSPIAPSLDTKFSGKTYVFNLSNNQWEARSTATSPQEYYSGSHPAVYDPSIGKIVLLKGTQTWHYDAAANVWEQVTTTGTPPSGNLAALAYDPVNQVIVRYGGSDGQYYSNAVTETWVYKGSTRTWTQVACHALPALGNALLYAQAFAYDPVHQCMLLNDPDLGVWAFKYNPSSPAGTQLIDSVPMVVGQAAGNPAATGPAGTLLSLPSPLNQRLLNMSDNSLLIIPGSSSNGAEIGWDYDPDKGVILKYGGCGNGSSPYWEHYGNNLDLFDPGTEKWTPRRVGEVSGAARPGNGCTRSTIYDSKRKKWWFFGGVGSGPYNPAPPTARGPYSYDVATDIITDHKVAQTVNPGNMGCILIYDPVHDITVVPDAGKIYVFDFATLKWGERAVSGGPGRLYGYNRMAWVTSMDAFVCFHGGNTWAYDPDLNQWRNLNPSNPPPARASKLGLAYDSRNDVVLLVGGQDSWNTGPHDDMWIYTPAQNRWDEVTPPAVSGRRPGNGVLMTAYDSRHNVFFIGVEGMGTNFAYRYKYQDVGKENADADDDAIGLTVYPNPFKATVKINYELQITNYELKEIKMAIYSIHGRLVKDLTDKIHNSSFVICNLSGLPAGVYLLKARIGNRSLLKKLVLVK